MDSNEGTKWSDCVLRIRPRVGLDAKKLTFAHRCLLNSEMGGAMLERGTGASYITVSDLDDLMVPLKFFSIYAATYSKYMKALKTFQFDEMQRLEQFVNRMMRNRGGS
jgi:hypothetical protein